MSLLNTFRFLTQHPLTTDRPWHALGRFICWQLGSRLVPGSVAVNFVNDTRLLVRPGMAGATGNVYAGLHEFEDMAFLLHVLRPDDLFVDVGANIGSYTVLAGGVVGAHCLSIEPIPDTFRSMLDNIRLNNLDGSVRALNLGVGRTPGVLAFTSTLDCLNHVITDPKSDITSIEVNVETLDSLLRNRTPTLIKIDVEGYENEVLTGANNTLENPGLMALIVEIGSTAGGNDSWLTDAPSILEQAGFERYRYQPFNRQLQAIHGRLEAGGNSLWVRNTDAVRERLCNASKFSVHGKLI